MAMVLLFFIVGGVAGLVGVAHYIVDLVCLFHIVVGSGLGVGAIIGLAAVDQDGGGGIALLGVDNIAYDRVRLSEIVGQIYAPKYQNA